MEQTQKSHNAQEKQEQSIKIDKLAEMPMQAKFTPLLPQKEANIVKFSRDMDNFYCDFSLQNSEKMAIVLTSQLDASIYELQMTKESKRQHEQLNFFETIEEIYEYISDNTQQGSKEGKQGMVHIGQDGRISINVVSTIGKKQRHRNIYLQTTKVMRDKEAYLENVVKKIGKNVLELKKELQSVKQKEEEIVRINTELLEKLKQYGSKIPFVCDKSDSHFGKFKQSDKKVTKVNDNTTYYSVFSESPVPKNSNSYFNIRLGSTLSKNVLVGIGSKFTKGITNVYSHQDFIGLYIYETAYIWEKGNQRDLMLKQYPIQQGCIITTNLNLALGYVSWQICGVRVAYAVIPSELRAKMLFPMVLMINVNDCIEVDP